MESITLHASQRTVIGKQVKALRRQNIIPGIIYGHHIEPQIVQFDIRHLVEILNLVGTSSTVEVIVEGNKEPYLAIVRDTQIDIIRRSIKHVDLQALSLTEMVRVPVAIILVGESPAIELGGVLVQILTELEIEALPNALIPSVEIDLSNLINIGDSVSVGDLVVPESVTILNPMEETIVQVTWQVIEEEEVVEEELLLGEDGEELLPSELTEEPAESEEQDA